MSNRHYFFILTLVFTTFIQSINAAYAASDGALDTTSTGDTSISIGVSNLVRISGIDDLSFGTYSGSGNFSKDQDVCIWTNQNGGNYKVKARGDGTSYAFTVSSGPGSILPYAVKWNGATGTSGNTALTADTLSGAFSGASTTSSTCAGGETANYQVIFSSTDLLDVRPGTYTGVLTFIISPS